MRDEAQPIGISPEYAKREFVGELNDIERVVLENEALCHRVAPAKDWRGNVLGAEGEVVEDDDDDDYADLLSGNVDDVNDYIDEHPDEADAVIAAERAGSSRKGIVGE